MAFFARCLICRGGGREFEPSQSPWPSIRAGLRLAAEGIKIQVWYAYEHGCGSDFDGRAWINSAENEEKRVKPAVRQGEEDEAEESESEDDSDDESE